MLGFERRWATAVLEGFAPPLGTGLAPRANEVDYAATLRSMMRASSRLARVGIRAAVWIVFLAPVWLFGRGATFATLPLAERAHVLDRMLSHRVYIVRELALLLKLAACMAMFRAPDLRARSGYDRDADWHPEEDVEQSGERVRVRLAIVAHDTDTDTGTDTGSDTADEVEVA